MVPLIDEIPTLDTVGIYYEDNLRSRVFLEEPPCTGGIVICCGGVVGVIDVAKVFWWGTAKGVLHEYDLLRCVHILVSQIGRRIEFVTLTDFSFPV